MSYREVRKLKLAKIDASSIFSFPIADVCLTPASRRGDVGQAPVPTLDAQITESRRGFARRVAVSLFFFFSFPNFLYSAALWFPSPVSVLRSDG
jgi:hypothetical protein